MEATASILNLRRFNWDTSTPSLGNNSSTNSNLVGNTASTTISKGLLSLGVINISKSQKSQQPLVANRTSNDKVISKLAVANNTIVAAVSNTSFNTVSLYRWQVRGASLGNPEEIEISDAVIASVERIVMDPAGHHAVIICSASSGSSITGAAAAAASSPTNLFPVYYLHIKSNKARRILMKLPTTDTHSFAVNRVESVAFDKTQCTENTAKGVLVATSLGHIFECTLSSTGDVSSSVLIQLTDAGTPVSISSLQIDTVTSATSASRIVVMCTSSKPARLYHFVGGPTVQKVFAAYNSTSVSSTELPSFVDGDHSSKPVEVHLQSTTLNVSQSVSGNQQTSRTFAVLTDMGIYQGSLQPSTSTGGGESMVLEGQFLPFTFQSPDSASVTPTAMALTEFHFLVLFPNLLHLICRITGRTVQEEIISTGASGIPLGLQKDVTMNSFWFYSSSQIFQASMVNEDQLVWSVFLSKALSGGEEIYFERAFQHCKTDEQRVKVKKAHAEFYLSAGRLTQAAQQFAHTGLPFAQIALLLVNCAPAFTAFLATNHASTSTSTSHGVFGPRDKDGVVYPVLSKRSPSVSMGASTSAAAAVTVSITSPEYSTKQKDKLSFLANAPGSEKSLTPEKAMDLLLTVGADLTPIRVYLSELLKVSIFGNNLQPLPSQTSGKYGGRSSGGLVFEVGAAPGSAGKSQRTMICTWLCEIYLHQITAAKLSAQSSQEEELTALFKDFLRNYKQCLDVPTTFGLITSRNSRPLLLFFSQIIGDYKRVVTLFMSEKKYMDAIKVLSDAPVEKVAGLIYKTAPILIEMQPEETMTMWLLKSQSSSRVMGASPYSLSQPQSLQLSVAGLLPALLRYLDINDRQSHQPHQVAHRVDVDFEGKKVNFAIRFLQQFILNLNIGFSFSFAGSDSTPLDLDALLTSSSISAQIEPCLIHSLVWMLAKYDQSQTSEVNSDLVALLKHLLVLREASTRLGLVSAPATIFGMEGEMDCEFILRQCRLYGKRRASVYALLLMDCCNPQATKLETIPSAGLGSLWSQNSNLEDLPTGGLIAEAVQEALLTDLKLAKEIASNEQHEGSLRKLLWLSILKHVIDQGSSSSRASESKSFGESKTSNTAATSAISIITESNKIITIDDLLPLLPDQTDIEILKDEICQSLEACGSRIEGLNQDMETLAESIGSTIQELDSMKSRSYLMNNTHQNCEFCSDSLLSQNIKTSQYQFYLFPCSHGFHAKCLLQRAKSHLLLDPSQLSAVRGLEDYIRAFSLNAKEHDRDREGKVRESSSRLRAQQDAYQLELDGYIAADCPLCGYVMVQLIGEHLISQDDAAEVKTWEL